jgi:hypothetical protein
MQGSITRIDSWQGLRPEFPSPPRVHWLTLFLVWTAAAFGINLLVHPPFDGLASCVVLNAWPVFFCHWLRNLSVDSTTFFWCDAYVLVQLVAEVLALYRSPSDTILVTVRLLGAASAVLGIVTIFIIRSELERHYNLSEAYGLSLSGIMTFFFSFLYFQAKLYPIAKLKHDVSTQLFAASNRPIE